MKKLLIGLLVIITAFSLTACSSGDESNEGTSVPEAEVNVPAEEQKETVSEVDEDKTYDGQEENLPADTGNTDALIFDDLWNYDESKYSFSNDDVKEKWENFKSLRDSGASTDELISALSEVTVADVAYVPGAIEYARYYMIRYGETGDTSSPANAMNALSYCYAASGDPLLIELKNELGWEKYSKIIEKALEALKQNNSAEAFEVLNTMPEEYFGINECYQIIEMLNYFDDSYYYLILGPALGNQYIVHFNLDGTYERVKMNEDGLYDSGTWKYDLFAEYCLSFDSGLLFRGGSGSYFCIQYNEDYEASEFTLEISKDGMAKDQFAYIAGRQTEESTEEVGSMATILSANLWQVEEGWYYRFETDGTGVVSMTDDSYSYGITYIEHPEKENTIIITPDGAPEDYEWVYDPIGGKFSQVSYGFDMNTETMTTFYADVYIYNE